MAVENGNGLRLTFEWFRGVWQVLLIISAIVYFVYEARGDIDWNREKIVETEERLSNHEQIMGRLEENLRVLRRIHEREDQRIRMRQDLLERWCRQGKLETEMCISEGIFQ